MTCVKCNKDLAVCVCADAEERFAEARKHVVFGVEYTRRILANIEKQKALRQEQQMQQE